MPSDVPGAPDESDLTIRLDELGPLSPTSDTRHEAKAALAFRRCSVNTGFSPDPNSAKAKFRIFNAEFVASAILAIAFVVLGCLYLVAAFGKKPNVAFGVTGGLVCFCFGALFVHSVIWGLCVTEDDRTLTARYHVLSKSLPIDHIEKFDVVPNLRMLRPVLTLMVITKSGNSMRTPLVATRSLAGEARLAEIQYYMNQRVRSPSPG